jgi:hypothetical protein
MTNDESMTNDENGYAVECAVLSSSDRETCERPEKSAEDSGQYGARRIIAVILNEVKDLAVAAKIAQCSSRDQTPVERSLACARDD